jgi:hypothetical protein
VDGCADRPGSVQAVWVDGGRGQGGGGKTMNMKMRASDVTMLRDYLNQMDPKNLENRRRFHENYEWLEGYWRDSWGTSGFNKFSEKLGAYYWSVDGFQTLANELAGMSPIGDSTKPNYEPNQTVIDATQKLWDGSNNIEELFKATMILIRQIRNNLFHGKKMEISDRAAYARNKELVRLARQITDILLEQLEPAVSTAGVE